MTTQSIRAARPTPLQRGWHSIRLFPVTLTLLAIVVSAGIVTGTVARDAFPALMARFGWDLDGLRHGRVYVLWPGLLFSSKPGVRVTMVAVLALGVGTLEYVRGSRVAAFVFLVVGPLASLLALLLLWPLDARGVGWVQPFLHEQDMGSSSASLACWGVAAASARGAVRYVLVAGTLLVLAVFAVLSPQAYIFDHLFAWALGLAIGVMMGNRSRRRMGEA